MNIFYLSNDVGDCAKYHVDKHVVKMILEYAQLLSTAHRVCDGNLISDDLDKSLYKATHVKHPSAIWVRHSKQNYHWLFNLWLSLMDEYTYRYNKNHASSRLIDHLCTAPLLSPNLGFTEPTPAMPDNFVVSGNSIVSYRNYYKYGKKHLHSWKGRNIPEWIY